MIKFIKNLMSKLFIDKRLSCRFIYNQNKSYYNIVKYFKDIINDNTVIVCIGTPDKNCKDILGPLIGKHLKDNYNFTIPVYGTISEPIQFSNASEKIQHIKKLHSNATIIAIDASIGDNLGEIHITNSSIIPGAARNVKQESIGDYSILGVVANDIDSICEKQTDMVKDIAKIITKGIELSYMIYKSKATNINKSIYNELKTVKYDIDTNCNIAITINGEMIKFNKDDLRKMNDDLILFELAKADGV